MCNDDSCRLGMPFTTDRSYMHLEKVENNSLFFLFFSSFFLLSFCFGGGGGGGGGERNVKHNGEHRI